MCNIEIGSICHWLENSNWKLSDIKKITEQYSIYTAVGTLVGSQQPAIVSKIINLQFF